MGLFLSLVYVKENSVWACFVIHAFYNGIGSIIPVDTQVTPDWPIVFILKTDNAFITGGQYGTDCSIVNMIAYIIMIFVLMKLIYKQRVIATPYTFKSKFAPTCTSSFVLALPVPSSLIASIIVLKSVSSK